MSPWASYLTSLGLGFHSFESTFLKELLQGLSGLIPVTMGWEDPLEEGMATHSSVLAWRIPWTEEPNGLQSMGLPRVGHN